MLNNTPERTHNYIIVNTNYKKINESPKSTLIKNKITIFNTKINKEIIYTVYSNKN
jgi:hypothetical protein